MSKTLMMASGFLSLVRFPFALAALAAAAVGCAFVPWGGVWDFMASGPFGADGFLSGLACMAVWLWAILSAVIAMVGLGLTLSGEAKLPNYPIWWSAWTVDEKTGGRHVEVWRVLVWLPFVPADLAGIALLSVYGLVKLLGYPCRLLSTAMAFDLAKLGRR